MHRDAPKSQNPYLKLLVKVRAECGVHIREGVCSAEQQAQRLSQRNGGGAGSVLRSVLLSEQLWLEKGTGSRRTSSGRAGKPGSSAMTALEKETMPAMQPQRVPAIAAEHNPCESGSAAAETFCMLPLL